MDSGQRGGPVAKARSTSCLAPVVAARPSAISITWITTMSAHIGSCVYLASVPSRRTAGQVEFQWVWRAYEDGAVDDVDCTVDDADLSYLKWMDERSTDRGLAGCADLGTLSKGERTQDPLESGQACWGVRPSQRPRRHHPREDRRPDSRVTQPERPSGTADPVIHFARRPRRAPAGSIGWLRFLPYAERK